MRPIQTPQTNAIFTADGCASLPAFRATMAEGEVIISYWQPTEEELIAIAAGQPIALILLADFQPPIILTTANEIMVEE